MTESRLTTPPMLSKEQQNVSSSMSTHSKMMKPVINSHPFVSQQDNTPHLHVSQAVSMSSENVPLLISEAQHPHMPRNSLQNISHGRSQQKIPQKQQYEKPCTTQPDINAIQNIDRIECDVKKGPSSTSLSVKSRRKSSSTAHAATNPENHNKDMSQKDLQKQDVSMINNPVSPLSSSSSHFSPTMLHKSTVESKMAEEPLSSNLKQQTKSTGCKPPLIERFRAPAAVSGEKGTSSDDDTTDGDDGDSGTDTDSVDDTISEDGNDENKEVSVKVKKQPDQPGMQSLQKQVQQVVQQFQHAEESSESDIESASEASDDSDDDDEDDDDGDSNDGNQDSDYSSSKRKSNADSGPPRKRRVVVIDEELMKIPLEKGWRRQTKLRQTSSGSGTLRGDVYYFAPCGKKIRTYPDVKKYIEKNGITDLDLTHFSFSMKLHLGEFLECTQGNEFRALTEEEVQERKRNEQHKQEQRLAKMSSRKEKKKEQQENAKKVAEAKMHRRLERQAAVEAAKQAKLRKAQEKLQQKLEKQEMLQAAKHAKKERARMLAEQKKRSKEEQKIQKLEKQKMEKEVKAQQIIEARKKKKEDVANARYYEAMRKAKERELRKQQAVLLKAQEKERLKEEKRRAKKLVKERKLEQKRREMILSRELKKPVEDMVLRDAKPLPELTRVKDLKITGNAFADLCMVQEFLHNFSQALDIDFENEVPSMCDIQASLLNENDEDVITPLCQTLLLAALDDPGVEGPCAETALGVKLDQVELNEHNVSEILRLFILARNAEPNEISDALTDKPFTALSPSQRAASLAFICNELLCGRTICREIENKIEYMSSLRHNKWIAEGNLRKLKAKQQQKFPESKIPPKTSAAAEEKKSGGKKTTNSVARAASTTNDKEHKRKTLDDEGSEGSDEEDDEDEVEEEEYDEDEEEDDVGGGEEDEAAHEDDDDDTDDESGDEEKPEPQTLEEFESRIRRLEKKQVQFRAKLFASSHSLRALYLGQDRFRRMYWVLPYGGSLYIEGNDSGETGLENFDFSKLGDVHSITETKNAGRPGVFSPGFSQHLEEMKSPTSDFVGQSKSNHGNGSCDDSFSMRLLMQHGKYGNDMSDTTPVRAIKNHVSYTSSHPSGSEYEDGNCNMGGMIMEGQSGPWFNLLPREPCDKGTITNCWMPSLYSQRVMLDSNSPRRPGRPPKQTKSVEGGLLSGSSRPVIQESIFSEAPQHCYHLSSLPRPLTLEEVRRSVMESLRQDPAPVPQDMKTGWWRVTDQRLLKDLSKTLHQRGIREKSLQKNILKFNDYTQHLFTKQEYRLSTDVDEEDEAKKTDEQDMEMDFTDDWFPDQAFAANKNILIEVEELEEKIFAASLQVKGWKLPPKASQTLTYTVKSDGSKPENLCGLPLTIAITRLASLEAGIERRYLKSPLRNDKLQIPSKLSNGPVNKNEEQTAEAGSQAPSEKEEIVTPALKLWRETVSASRTPAQLYMCLMLLNDCIAWEKSIMKVFCQMCRKGDNEELLLLCDGCDRGYHTYCCQPKFDEIPQGDWYCTDCIIMATGKSCCFTCRGTQERLLRCTQCPRNYHPQCVDPPLSKIPRCWSCPNCKKVKSKSRSRASTTSRKRKKHLQDEKDAKVDKQNLSTIDESRHLNRKQCSKDMAPCRMILAEMEKHEEAWPFLVPVNPKQFPEYYTIILSPMDFHTMKVKLRDFQYTSREDFAADTRLIFDNCNHYNEDESEIGQAGKRLRQFFEKRWLEINRDSD
ncbi:bromodomain adjacent to zinc finger domain protein 2B-like isoform X2 [Xenia sp. Carnegie-2017]|uniref:bromodomain adjacent to zinc finger domain protein 2B-like isoform X2 n=1 Tax=Xenia sp. Carnegie-2017 TaxID=2897299 RepID=UPI001F040FA9|nr:bromodomain adjacent to zinc finger domain protein 2B-like isoform X2 [Xenia sp. Carnegie-2017]